MKIFLVLSFYLLSSFAGFCNPGSIEMKDKSMKYTISEIEKLSGLDFPSEAKVLFEADEGSGGEDYIEWVIHSPEQIAIDKEKWEGGSRETLNLIKSVLPDYDFGTLKMDAATDSIWNNESGKWQAKMVETDKGFFLRLELFKNN